jgi:hypothetical protein
VSLARQRATALSATPGSSRPPPTAKDASAAASCVFRVVRSPSGKPWSTDAADPPVSVKKDRYSSMSGKVKRTGISSVAHGGKARAVEQRPRVGLDGHRERARRVGLGGRQEAVLDQ